MPDKKLMVAIGFGILAVGSLLYGIFTPSKVRRELASSAGPGTPAAATVSTKPAVLTDRMMKRTPHESWGRNPFASKEAPAIALGGGALILNGIAWDEKSPQAIINDRIVKTGDEVGGSRVVTILQHKVILNDGVSDFELRPGQRRQT